MKTHYVQYGDSLTPLGVVLKQRNTAGVLAAVDLTGLTVKVVVVDHAGTEVVPETTTGVTVVDADAGQVQYDLPAGNDALEAGTYYVYFRVYSGTERDTYPVEPKEMRIIVKKHIQDGTSS